MANRKVFAVDSPQTYIKQLVGYLTDDAAIAMHCNRNFGTSVTAKRVAQIRSTMPKRRVR